MLDLTQKSARTGCGFAGCCSLWHNSHCSQEDPPTTILIFCISVVSIEPGSPHLAQGLMCSLEGGSSSLSLKETWMKAEGPD